MDFWNSGIFSGLVAANALGIGAASFASKSGTSFGDGDEIFWTGFWERDENLASKDIAESPTAIAGTPRLSVELSV